MNDTWNPGNGSIWDRPEMNVAVDYIRFETPGDTVDGIVRSITAHEWPDKTVSPKVLLDTVDGERTVTAGQYQLKAELARLRPEAGDRLRIEFTGVEPRPGGKTLKLFNVTVTRKNAADPAAAAVDALRDQNLA